MKARIANARIFMFNKIRTPLMALVLTGLFGFLVGCGPADQAVQERLGNAPPAAKVAAPTETILPVEAPQDEPEPTATPTPEPTATPACVYLTPDMPKSTNEIVRNGARLVCWESTPSPPPKYPDLGPEWSAFAERAETRAAELRSEGVSGDAALFTVFLAISFETFDQAVTGSD